MITEEQKLQRRAGVGSSDIPSIFGLGFRTARDVWMEKRGLLTESPSNEAMDMGNRFEDDVLDWFAQQVACIRMTRDVSLVGPEPWMLANLDADLVMPEGMKAVADAKTAGLLGFSPKLSEWGDEHTDEIPAGYILQVQWQMFVAGPDYQLAYVPLLINDGGLEFRLYKVRRDERTIADVVDGAREFWRMVEEGIEPEGAISPDVAKCVIRTPSAVPVALAPSLVSEYIAANERRKAAEKEEEEIKGRMIAALGQGDAGVCSIAKVSYRSVEREGFDQKTFSIDHPDLAQKYRKVTSYRTLRVAAAK